MCLNVKPFKPWLMNSELTLECGPGWTPLIEEKLGGLRFYYRLMPEPADEAIYSALRRIIESVEARSFVTCEYCGAAGKLRETDFGWLSVSCEWHAKPGSRVIS